MLRSDEHKAAHMQSTLAQLFGPRFAILLFLAPAALVAQTSPRSPCPFERDHFLIRPLFEQSGEPGLPSDEAALGPKPGARIVGEQQEPIRTQRIIAPPVPTSPPPKGGCSGQQLHIPQLSSIEPTFRSTMSRAAHRSRVSTVIFRLPRYTSVTVREAVRQRLSAIRFAPEFSAS